MSQPPSMGEVLLQLCLDAPRLLIYIWFCTQDLHMSGPGPWKISQGTRFFGARFFGAKGTHLFSASGLKQHKRNLA